MTPGWFLLLAAIGIVVGIAAAFTAPRLWLSATILGLGAAFVAAIWILVSGDVWEWQPDFYIGGESLHLRLDAISAFFLVLLTVVGSAGTLYSSEYWTDKDHPASAPAGRAWWNILFGNLGLILLLANGLHFLIVWELFTISSYFLITLHRDRRANPR